MNRRGFFRALGAGAAAALVPSIVIAALSAPPTGGKLLAGMVEHWEYNPEYQAWLWTVTTHLRSRVFYYARIFESPPHARPDKVWPPNFMKFYYDDACYAFKLTKERAA